MDNVSLVKEPSSQVYFYCGGTKFPIPQQDFDDMGFVSSKVKVLPPGTLTSVPEKSFVASPSVKPSDVFFRPPCPPDMRPWRRTTCHDASHIVAKNIMVAGWIRSGSPYCNSGIFDGDGLEDILYDIILDVDFIDKMYGPGGLSRALESEVLPGNPTPQEDGDVETKMLRDESETHSPRGVTVNSFTLFHRTQERPSGIGNIGKFMALGNDFADMHCELNAWNENTNGRVLGRGPHPEGWIQVPIHSPECYNETHKRHDDAWFPYHPLNPDGSGNLNRGNYVIFKGTLYQDGSHGDAENHCWEDYDRAKGHGGWPEIHPIDWIMRPVQPPPVPQRKTAWVINVCTPAGVSIPVTKSLLPLPEEDIWLDVGRMRLAVSDVRELIDGRFTDMSSIARHDVTIVKNQPTIPHDYPRFDVVIGGPGRPAGHFKAAYVLTWKQKENTAEFVSRSVSQAMDPGKTYNAQVVMRNVGTNTWIPDGSSPYRLGYPPDTDEPWGKGRVALPYPVAPGSSATFDFTVTAPSTSGAYKFQWRMLQETKEWFGDITTTTIFVGNVVTVPDVINASRESAASDLFALDLQAQFYGATNARATYVASQNPDSGTRVPRGSTVSCRLVHGEPPVG